MIQIDYCSLEDSLMERNWDNFFKQAILDMVMCNETGCIKNIIVKEPPGHNDRQLVMVGSTEQSTEMNMFLYITIGDGSILCGIHTAWKVADMNGQTQWLNGNVGSLKAGEFDRINKIKWCVKSMVGFGGEVAADVILPI
eukprot:g38241.t1